MSFLNRKLNKTKLKNVFLAFVILIISNSVFIRLVLSPLFLLIFNLKLLRTSKANKMQSWFIKHNWYCYCGSFERFCLGTWGIFLFQNNFWDFKECPDGLVEKFMFPIFYELYCTQSPEFWEKSIIFFRGKFYNVLFSIGFLVQNAKFSSKV